LTHLYSKIGSSFTNGKWTWFNSYPKELAT
jgi:hypothetical protein